MTSLSWNPVKELKVDGHYVVDADQAVPWNPVKELKDYVVSRGSLAEGDASSGIR